STVAGGLKGTAKRTAFGDLSNTAGAANQHAVAGNGLGKHALSAAMPTTKVYKDANKENAVKNKEALLRPAQRPSTSLKPSMAAQGLPAVADTRAQPVPKQTGARKTTMVYHDEYQQKPRSLNRHYRSQPQLKSTEAPVIRRSASKHVLQNIDYSGADDDIDAMPYENAMEELPCDEQALQGSWMPVPGPVGPLITAEMEPLQPEPAAAPSDLLPSGLVMPESEEYWDEEDDEYDEQGYTTAHSYKSYGDNTTSATSLVIPRKTVKDQRELDEARAYVESIRPRDEADEENWDVSMVAEYGEEIFEYMRELEDRMRPNPHYMEQVQLEIQWSMRSILMDWLVQVHSRFSLLPETLFLTVNYIDRFLSCKMVSLGKLQLVGATAIFIAAKYEEINCPSVQEIVYMVDNGYTMDEILKAERFMLSMLQFELGWPGPMSFLRRISKADDYDLETRTLAKYFLEVTIMDERFVGCTPSYIAAGAHCLARLILNKGDWSLPHVHFSGYTWAQLRPLVAVILDCCQTPDRHHKAVYEKYRDRRFKKSSTFVRDELAKGFTL
ncbi:hypothetical protein M406DRAFT_217651, partial [Cryphonectria parasitica EP155]